MIAARTRPAMLACALTLAVALAACSDAPGDRVVPPERKAPSLSYVALGGDDAAGGRTRLASTWPHVLFRTALPRSATLLDLARPRSGIGDVREQQVDAAIDARPDLVTVTLLDDAERSTDPDAVEADLDAVLARLGARAGIRVFVGTVPDDAADPTTVGSLNAAIRAAVSRHDRVTLVDLATVGRADTPVGATSTARAFARAAGLSPGRSP